MTRTLITNVRLWDGLAETALPNAAVLIDGERIVWAGPRGDAPVATGEAELVDGRGGTLLPGLIDCHIHLAMSRAPSPPVSIASERPGPAERVRTTSSAQSISPQHWGAGGAALPALATAAALDIGITAVRDLGARDHSAIAAGREIAAGRAPGPDVIAAGRPLALPNGYMTGVAVEVSDPAGVRAAVAEQVAAGAGVIKVIASPVPAVRDESMPRSFGPENLEAAVAAAHAAKLRVTAHAHSLAGARDAVLAGFDCIEHGYRLDAATIAEMARRGTWLVPTLVAMEASQAPMLAPGRPEADAARARERWEAAADAAHQAHRAGVRLATGTDAPSIVPVDAIRREVALLVEAAGLTPVEALRAATSAAADLLGLPGRAGVIAPGATAGLLLVDGDPLSDPACLARVRAVWSRGQRVRGRG